MAIQGSGTDVIDDDRNFLLSDSKQLRFGTGNDHRLFHNGSHLYHDCYLGDYLIRDRTGASAVTRYKFTTDGQLLVESASNNGPLIVQTSVPNPDNGTAMIKNKSTTLTSTILYSQCNRTASLDWRFFTCISDQAGTPDNEFSVTGNGNVYADGNFNAFGADYAEYFEWEDGNLNNEDRRGLTVSLVGNKIRLAQPEDEIIGVISASPVVVGDNPWDHWKDKYLIDDYGSIIWEEYTITKWSYENEEGELIDAEYQSDKIPPNLEVPNDAEILYVDAGGNTLKRKKINPEWNPSTEYIPREKRKEWDTVGLVGKLRVRKGQPVGDRWIKMRDVSDSVEEWLVR